ncbi:MAG: hypothetical protein R3D33_13540 [Hyphomicrobiaceae bacterium]
MTLAFTPPSLALSVAKPPEGDHWLHEIKFDGYRIQAIVENGSARLMTRSGRDWTMRFGSLARAVAALPVASAVIDGEAVVLDGKGVSRFEMLQAELKLAASDHIVLMTFDLLHLDHHDIGRRPLLERKALLVDIFARRSPTHGRIHFVDHMTGNGRKMLAEACIMGLEGIVSKRGDRPYRSGRHSDWTKTKCANRAHSLSWATPHRKTRTPRRRPVARLLRREFAYLCRQGWDRIQGRRGASHG